MRNLLEYPITTDDMIDAVTNAMAIYALYHKGDEPIGDITLPALQVVMEKLIKHREHSR